MTLEQEYSKLKPYNYNNPYDMNKTNDTLSEAFTSYYIYEGYASSHEIDKALILTNYTKDNKDNITTLTFNNNLNLGDAIIYNSEIKDLYKPLIYNSLVHDIHCNMAVKYNDMFYINPNTSIQCYPLYVKDINSLTNYFINTYELSLLDKYYYKDDYHIIKLLELADNIKLNFIKVEGEL